MRDYFLEPTEETGTAFFQRDISGEVVMLNMLRLREVANYSGTPQLSPEGDISGREAFQKYIDQTMPLLIKSGGELLLLGEGGNFFIGPGNEQWDVIMLVKQSSVESFFAFTTSHAHLEAIGHRTAAVLDSRLLPIVELKNYDMATDR